MSEPITWQALEVVIQRIQTITQANGYHTDLGLGLVTLDTGRDPEGQPMVLVYATEIPIDESATGTRTTRSEMEVVVDFFVPFDSGEVAELIAHRGRADLVRALRGGLRGAPQGISNLRVTGSRIGSPEEAAGLVVAQVTARVSLSETSPATP